jgi:hypothetical protein
MPRDAGSAAIDNNLNESGRKFTVALLKKWIGETALEADSSRPHFPVGCNNNNI